MTHRIFKWKHVGIFAAVIGISVILSGCGSDEQTENRPGMYPTTPDPSTILQPTEAASNDTSLNGLWVSTVTPDGELADSF